MYIIIYIERIFMEKKIRVEFCFIIWNINLDVLLFLKV